MVPFIILWYKAVLTFESVDEILKCDHSKAIEQYFPVVRFFMLFKVVLAFDSVDEMQVHSWLY